MKKVSLVYNLDSRPKWKDARTSTADCDGGCRSTDFFTDGLLNKIEFLKSPDVELEVIVYVDIHEPLTEEINSFFDQMIGQNKLHHLIIKQHSAERFGSMYGKKNNDLIYVEALDLATGDYVVHFDSDIAAFRKSDVNMTQWYMYQLENYKYVSIPSDWSPNCVDISSIRWQHMDYMWASTRFFICERKTLPSKDELLKCFNNDYLESHYGKAAKPNCLEHILGVIAEPGSVYYPPMSDFYLILSWSTYWKGMLGKLNTMPFQEVRDYVFKTCGGIFGANDVVGQPL